MLAENPRSDLVLGEPFLLETLDGIVADEMQKNAFQAVEEAFDAGEENRKEFGISMF